LENRWLVNQQPKPREFARLNIRLPLGFVKEAAQFSLFARFRFFLFLVFAMFFSIHRQ